jgi:hypothetical protein
LLPELICPLVNCKFRINSEKLEKSKIFGNKHVSVFCVHAKFYEEMTSVVYENTILMLANFLGNLEHLFSN